MHATTWRTGHPPTDRLVAAFVERAAAAASTGGRARDVATPGPRWSTTSSRCCWPSWSTTSAPISPPGRATGCGRWPTWCDHEDGHADVELPCFGHELFVQALATGGRAGDAYAEARARNLEWAVSTCLEPGLDGADVLVAPAYGPAWKSDLVVGGHAGAVSSWVTTPAAIAGWPIMSVPVGLVHGLPVGLALIARPGEEWTLLAAGAGSRPWWRRTGPLPRPGLARARTVAERPVTHVGDQASAAAFSLRRVSSMPARLWVTRSSDTPLTQLAGQVISAPALVVPGLGDRAPAVVASKR